MGLNSFSHYEKDITYASVECIKQVLKSSNIDPLSVDALVYATNTIKHTEPHLDVLRCAMYDLGLRDTYPYGVSFSGCGNLNSAMRIATSLISAGHHSNVVLVAVDIASDSYSTKGSRIYSNNVSIFSDGAAACLVTKDIGGETNNRFRILCAEQVSDSRMVEYGRESNFTEAMSCSTQGIVEASRRALRQANIGCNDIRALITNNYNTSVTCLFSMAIGLSESKVFSGNLGRYGHVYSADGLINLASFAKTAPLRVGDKIMMLGSGPSTWSVSILAYGD